MELWEKNKMEELLIRIEEQHMDVQSFRRRRSNIAASPGVRARKLARDGAYRKAVMSLTSSLAELSPEEEQKWASQLLPRSIDAQNAIAQADGPEATKNEEEIKSSPYRCLSGVRFAALSQQRARAELAQNICGRP